MNNRIALKDILYKFNKYVKEENISFKLITNEEITTEEFSNQRQEFETKMVYDVFKEFRISNINNLKNTEHYSRTEEMPMLCNSYCSTYGSFGNCKFSSGECEGGICGRQATKDKANELEEFALDVIVNAFDVNEDEAYDFRDDFLMDKQLGQKYISYYYAISDFILTEDLDLSLVTKIIDGMPSVDLAIAKLLSTNSENEIIIDNQFKSDIDEILDILKSKSTNNDFHLLMI